MQVYVPEMGMKVYRLRDSVNSPIPSGRLFYECFHHNEFNVKQPTVFPASYPFYHPIQPYTAYQLFCVSLSYHPGLESVNYGYWPYWLLQSTTALQTFFCEWSQENAYPFTVQDVSDFLQANYSADGALTFPGDFMQNNFTIYYQPWRSGLVDPHLFQFSQWYCEAKVNEPNGWVRHNMRYRWVLNPSLGKVYLLGQPWYQEVVINSIPSGFDGRWGECFYVRSYRYFLHVLGYWTNQIEPFSSEPYPVREDGKPPGTIVPPITGNQGLLPLSPPGLDGLMVINKEEDFYV